MFAIIAGWVGGEEMTCRGKLDRDGDIGTNEVSVFAGLE